MRNKGRNASFSIFEDWDALIEKLSTRQLSDEMIPVLKILLATARSRRELEHLHDETLNSNKRLCREDFLSLAAFWDRYFKSRGSEVMPNTQAFFLLNRGVSDRGMEDYYVSLLMDCALNTYRTLSDVAVGFDKHCVYSDASRMGHGYYHYQISTSSGRWMDMRCMLSESKLRVFLLLMGRSLTEELVHEISLNFPKYDLVTTGGSTKDGRFIDLVYDFDSDPGLLATITELPDKYSSKGKLQIGGADFLAAVFKMLIDRGLPVQQATMITK